MRIQRGVPLAGLLYGRQGADGIPHVRGVRTEAGEEICADLVVDAMGRRSPLQRWLTADGLNPGTEAVEDSGFVYYGCHIRLDGPPQPPIINYYGSISVMILPADNGTAGVGIIGWSGDVALRPLRHEAHWRAALELYPEGEMILAGTPIGGMVTMAGIEDRRRGFMAEGRPVVTGLVSVADAWAATNPALGRGISLGFRHVIHLRDTLDAVGLDQPLALARTFGEVTERDLGPWYESTIWHDRHRLGDAIASAREEERELDGEWDLFLRFMSAFRNDPVLGMRFLETALLTETPNQLLADPQVRSRLADVPEPQPVGPGRAELLAAISG